MDWVTSGYILRSDTITKDDINGFPSPEIDTCISDPGTDSLFPFSSVSSSRLDPFHGRKVKKNVQQKQKKM